MPNCLHCGKEFDRRIRGNDANSYCSRACAFVVQKKNAEMNRPAPFSSVHFHTCRVCGLGFVTTRANSVVCSDECRKNEARAANRVLNSGKKILSERACKGCNVLFVPEYGNKARTFCSPECGTRHSRKIAKYARKARVRGATLVEKVVPSAVFDRDGWVCRRCGVATPRAKRGSFCQDAPELDHVIPLSKGGAHTYANTQCLCRKCNSDKSDTVEHGD